MKERQEEILHLLTENQQGLTASDVAERLIFIEAMQADI